MKKMMKYFTAAFVAIVAVSCVKEMETGASQEAKKMVDVTFGVNIADEDITKTSLGVENDAPAVLWSEGDKVAVWDGTQINEFNLVSGAGTSNAMFTGQVTEGATEYCVIYPYECVLNYDSKDGNYHLFKIVPLVEQKVPVNGFAEKANVSVGYTTDLTEGLTMYNAGGYFRIEVKGTGMKSVTVFDNANNVIAGSNMACIPVTNGDGYFRGRSDALASNKIVLLPEEGKTELAEGVYYLVARGLKHASGITVKFEHVNGSVAYYSSSSQNNTGDANVTINLGSADVSTLNWKKQDIMEFDFESQNWPFNEELSDSGSSATSIDAAYTATSNGKSLYIKSVAHASEAVLSNRGLRMATADNDYIEFPAVAGKRLKEVKIYSMGKFTGVVEDENGNSQTGNEYYIRTNGTYTYILPKSELNTKYRLAVTAVKSVSTRVTKLTLVYAGEDRAEISGMTASAVNSFVGFTVIGEAQGSGLDAATWGIQYATVENEWIDGPTGSGGKIKKLVEAPVNTTYYVRTWISADNGTTKVYSDISIVTVKPFSGKVVFDFTKDAAEANLRFVGTSDTDAAEFEDIHKNRNITGEDYWIYSYDGANYPFTMFGMWDSENNTRKQWAYCLSYEGHSSGLVGVLASANNKNYWMSIPMIDGYRLINVNVWSHATGRTLYVTTTSTSTTRIGSCTNDGTAVDGMYKHTADVSSKSETGVQYYIYMGTNAVHPKYEFVYEKVN